MPEAANRLYGDVEFMLRRGSASRLKVDGVLRRTRRSINKNGASKVYSTFSARVKYNLCCARILQGDFSDWDGWVHRDEWAEAMRYGVSNIPFWDGRNVDRLVVVGEQGVGDEVLFASLLPEAMIRCKNVTYRCDPRLTSLFERSFKGLITKPRYVDARDDIVGDYDAYVPAADLLPLFRQHRTHFPRKPFLKPDQARIKEFERYRGRVGLSWTGRHGHIDPMGFNIGDPLSLQYNDQHRDTECPEIDLKDDLEGVVALCSVLSKVVCVPTSVWHFAAAVGTPTEVVVTPKSSEAAVDGIVDELDWHCQIGASPYYGKSVVYSGLAEWKRDVR
jgi:hypothetical protein